MFLFSIYCETEDLYYPKGSRPFCKKNKTSGDGHGRYYLYGRGNDKDDIPKLLDRIQWTADYEKRTVKWRRCLILAIIISCVCLCVPCDTNHVKSFAFKLLIIMVFIYFSFSYYYYHHDKFPAMYIKENIDRIKSILKLNNEFIQVDILTEKL